MATGTGDGGPRKEESGFSIVNTLSIVIVAGFIGMIPLWMWFPPNASEGVLAIINSMMGGLGIAFATVIAYHFGSSRSTKDLGTANREAMTTMAATAATVASTAAVVAAATPPAIKPPDQSPVHVEGDVTVTDAPEGATAKLGATEAKGVT